MKAIGTTNDVTTCECCGRQELKKTVALVELDDDGNAVGDPTFYGVNCAARATGRPTREIRVEAKSADAAKRRAEANARLSAAAVATEDFHAWLARNGSGSDVPARIESLGGYSAARAAYKESN